MNNQKNQTATKMLVGASAFVLILILAAAAWSWQSGVSDKHEQQKTMERLDSQIRDFGSP